MSLQIKVVGRTDIGLVRPGNEDCLHLDERNHVYAVCDGMGGHQAGEVASMMASDIIHQAFTQFSSELLDYPLLSVGRTLPPSGDLLLKSIRLANRAVYNKAMSSPTLTGMGTTIVAAAFEADVMSVAHVGDSRAYRLGERALEPLTRDHSWVAEIQASHNMSEEEATSFVGKNVITRALGVRATVEADFRIIKVKPGDQFLLCSDGLCGYADDDEIFDVASRFRANLAEMIDALIQMANDRGGSDNVTVIALQVLGIRESPLPEVSVFTLKEETPETVAAEDRWLARLAEAAPERRPPQGGKLSKAGGSKIVLLLIFLVFAVAAVLIIWFLPQK
ncbi:MAG: Stp1/IreP family PP2C-type Ser/Thr phosphatase [Candidatus Zixiibacteriota bacterium]